MIYYFRKIHARIPKDFDLDTYPEDFLIELRGPFHNSRNASEKGSSCSRNSSECLSDHFNSSEKSSSFLNNENSGIFSSSAFADSSILTFEDSMQSNHGKKRRWEEERSKLFRHKLEESKNISKFVGDKNHKLGRKASLNLSSIDKIQGASKFSLPPSSDQKDTNYRSSVLLYSYQNPPFSLPPSGGCRKTSDHTSLPMDFRSSVAKALPPIAIKTTQNIEPVTVGGAKLNNITPKDVTLIKDKNIIQQSNILTADSVSEATSSSAHGRILRTQLPGESAA